MVIQTPQTMTVTDFDTWVTAQTGDYEYVAGEVLTVVSNNYASQIAMLVGAFITLFARQHNLGYVTGSDGGYQVNGERYIPDVGYISKERQPQPSHDAYNPNPPDLAVEVVSPTDSERNLLIKVSNYLAVGTDVWIVYPQEREVHVHQSGQGVTILSEQDTLTTETLLPGFSLPVKDIFPSQSDT